MKRSSPQRSMLRHSLVAFLLTVALALVAFLMQLLPDITAQSANTMSALPDGLGQMVLGADFK